MNEVQFSIVHEVVDMSYEASAFIKTAALLVLMNQDDVRLNNKKMEIVNLRNAIDKLRSLKYESTMHKTVWTRDAERVLMNEIVRRVKEDGQTTLTKRDMIELQTKLEAEANFKVDLKSLYYKCKHKKTELVARLDEDAFAKSKKIRSMINTNNVKESMIYAAINFLANDESFRTKLTNAILTRGKKRD